MLTFSDVPSENDVATPDRRTRKREARRDGLLDLAAELVEQHGVDGLTMAALADASDYATASLYTYFPSRSALLAALQQRALAVLAQVATEAVTRWDEVLRAPVGPAGPAGPALALEAPEATRSLARLWAFADLFLTAPDHHPREFVLQQQLLVSPQAEDVNDALSVVPAAMAVLVVPQQLLADAAAIGAIRPGPAVSGPLDDPLPLELVRTLSWVTALNGALMVDRLSTGLPTTGAHLGREITASLLVGWGADPVLVTHARRLAADHLAPVHLEPAPLAPPPPDGVHR